MTLIVYQAKMTQKMVLLGFLTFVIGLVAIPSLLNIETLQGALVNMMPCNYREDFKLFLQNSFIPFVTIISFVQALPLMFHKPCVPVCVKDRREYIQHKTQKLNSDVEEWKNYLQKANEMAHEEALQLLGQYNVRQIEAKQEEEQNKISKYVEEIDYEESYKAAKLANAPFNTIRPRDKFRFLKDEKEQKEAVKL